MPGNFPFQSPHFSPHFLFGMVYHYVKISKSRVSSDFSEAVIAIGLLQGDIVIWELKYVFDVLRPYFSFEGFVKIGAANSSNAHLPIREDGIAVSINEMIIYIVCNNETFSTQKREVWHLNLSNMTWILAGMISVPYKEEKLFGHVVENYSILVICSTMSCTKYTYEVNGWYFNEIVQFASGSQNAFSFSAYENSIIILNKCVFHNLIFTAKETIVGEIQSNAEAYLSFENASSIVSTSADNTQYFLFFLNLQTAIVLTWYFERKDSQHKVQYQVIPFYRNLPSLYGYTLSYIQEHLMVFGGVKGIYDPHVLPQSEEDLNADIWYLNSNLNTYSYQSWRKFRTKRSSFPPSRFFHSAVFVYDDDGGPVPAIIVYGGLGFVKEKLVVFNDLWKFEASVGSDLDIDFPDSSKWARVLEAENSMPFPKMFRHTAIQFSISLILFLYLVAKCSWLKIIAMRRMHFCFHFLTARLGVTARHAVKFD